MRFEVGKYYKHASLGKVMHIVSYTTIWGGCLMGEEHGSDHLHPIGQDETSAENWFETTEEAWVEGNPQSVPRYKLFRIDWETHNYPTISYGGTVILAYVGYTVWLEDTDPDSDHYVIFGYTNLENWNPERDYSNCCTNYSEDQVFAIGRLRNH